jgi:hypothetical protein
MRRVVFPLLIVLFAACSESPTTPSTGQNAVELASGRSPVHRVSVGGPDICSSIQIGSKPGCDGNFSLVAFLYADGSADGQLHDQYTQGDGLHARIDCLLVAVIPTQVPRLEAWIGAVVDRPAELAGHRIVVRARDRGKSQQDAPDAFSSGMVDPEDFGISSNCQDKPMLTLFRVAEGQVSIW